MSIFVELFLQFHDSRRISVLVRKSGPPEQTVVDVKATNCNVLMSESITGKFYRYSKCSHFKQKNVIVWLTTIVFHHLCI